ncbi:MAG: exodeoxyribonuclease VII large subunit [Rhodocyclaceae bacterium]|nr:exodeoxyribonuclease VII large subunit [Rhodocyclaceae bacterium]
MTYVDATRLASGEAGPDAAAPLSVTAINRLARTRLETAIPLLWVTGEVSNLVRAASGHQYFSLKDAQSAVRCVLFRGRAGNSEVALANGQQVDVRASATLYEPRGEFQLQVDTVRLAGLGARFAALEALRRKLLAEGALDAARKRPLPFMPRAVGIVTSPTGAAIRDLLRMLGERMPGLRVILYPTLVQGEAAPDAIAEAIATAGRRAEVDVLIVGRGGGSIEDLWAFNSERVARALLACPIPTVSAVGHETDTLLSDLVADVRAPTPTAAAALVCPDRRRLIASLEQLWRHLQREMARDDETLCQRLDHLSTRLLSPAQRIEMQSQRLALLRARMGRRWLDEAEARVAQGAAALALLSPARVLKRGYAWVSDAEGRVVRGAGALAEGDALDLHFADGVVPVAVMPPRRSAAT